ncbi:MAG: hypothetical protein U0R24_04165 [Solirubrobacterales bacterium]
MRTTVTLDDDIAARLRDVAHERGVPFKTAINDAIRAGLEEPSKPRPFRVKPKDMGPARVDLTKALQLAGEMEDAEIVRKMNLGK